MIEALGVAVDVSVWMIGPAFSFGLASWGGGEGVETTKVSEMFRDLVRKVVYLYFIYLCSIGS
jgi:hypothetical protein